MKNILKYSLILIGTGFISFGIYLLFLSAESPEREQIFAMAGVGALFLLGGIAMGKR